MPSCGIRLQNESPDNRDDHACKGARRPSPQQRLDDPNTPWTTLEVEHWYGGEKREVEIYTETCVWYKSGFHPVLIRWVLVRDPQGAIRSASLSFDACRPHACCKS